MKAAILLPMGKFFALLISLFVLFALWHIALDKIPPLQRTLNRLIRWGYRHWRKIQRIRLVKEDINFLVVLAMSYGVYLLLWALHNHNLTRRY